MSARAPGARAPAVALLGESAWGAPVAALLGRYRLTIRLHAQGSALPGSYWGAPEAGLVRNVVHAREDTPVHSVFHEACHYVCMSPARRAGLDTDAGGDYEEENAVCCLQIVLADELPGFGRSRMCTDMDAWGYTFRLGSAARWYAEEADDARRWLAGHGILDGHGRPTWNCREA